MESIPSFREPNRPHARRDDDRASVERAVVANFEALVFRQAFAPLAKAIGFYGDAVVDAAARAMSRAREDAR